MSVIIFSKRTNKYLRRHSGSFRYAKGMLKYKKDIEEEIVKIFGPSPLHARKDIEAYNKYHSKIRQFCEDKLFNAEVGDAKVYASKGSVMTSVGILRDDWRTADKVYKLPDRFEIHEIKSSSVCVIRPDGNSNCDDK